MGPDLRLERLPIKIGSVESQIRNLDSIKKGSTFRMTPLKKTITKETNVLRCRLLF